MADRDQKPDQPHPAPQLRAPQASPASDAVDALRSLAAAAQGGDTGQDPKGGNAGDEAPGSSRGTEDATIEVEFKGARKRVPVSDLLAKATKADELETQNKALAAMLEKNAAAAAFVKSVESMDPEDREAFSAVLANPKLARQLRQQPAPRQQSNEEDEIIEGLNDYQKPRQRPTEPPADDAVRQTLGILLEDYRQRRAQQETMTLEQKIDGAMNQYPGFQNLETEGKRFAREAIVNALARNPKANLDDVVAQNAAHYERMLARRSDPDVGGAQPRTFQPQDPGKPFTADDLLNGKLGKALLADFRRSR